MIFKSECRRVMQSLLDYSAGRLTAPERSAVERHLDACIVCRTQAAEYGRAIRLAEEARQQPQPASQTSWHMLRIQLESAQTGQSDAGRPLYRHPGRWALAGALTAGAAGLLLWMPHHLSFLQSSSQVSSSSSESPLHSYIASSQKPSSQKPSLQKPLAVQSSIAQRNGSYKSLPTLRQSLTSRAIARTEPSSRRATYQPLKSLKIAHVPNIPTVGKSMARDAALNTSQSRASQAVALRTSLLPVLRTKQVMKPSLRIAVSPAYDDLDYLNVNAAKSVGQWLSLPPARTHALEAELTRMVETTRKGDDFITLPLPQIAGQGAQAVRAAIAVYQQQAIVVDARLARKVRLGVKAIALSELCKQLSEETGIVLTTSARVADDNVTLFCNLRPLRDIMRQVSEHFGFQWQREGQEGAYRYELTQSLRSQLLEEEMRNEDQDAGLIALDHAMQNYRKYRGLTTSQLNDLAEKSKSEDAIQIFPLAKGAWLPASLYFGLSPEDMQILRSGQPIKFSMSPENGERPLPAALTPEILKSFEDVRINPHPGKDGPPLISHNVPADSLPLSEAKEIGITSELRLDRSQLGQFALKGDVFLAVTTAGAKDGIGHGMELAKSTSPATGSPQNALANAKHAHDPDLQTRLSIEPLPSCKLEFGDLPDTEGISQMMGMKATTADVLEALFKATGKDIIGDFYTQLYTPAKVTERTVTLFDGLNRVGDTMQARWTKEEGWLKFRNRGYFYERPKEVPARLLKRWAASRREHGVLTIDDLSEISQLSNTQLDALSTYAGALARYDLKEWNFARAANLRENWRWLAAVPGDVRQDALSARGLQIDRLSLALQKRFVALAFRDNDTDIRPGSKEVQQPTLRIEYNALMQNDKSFHHLLPGNPIVFLYTYGEATPGFGKRTSVIGPFNGVFHGAEVMTEQMRERNR